jgi:cysteine-rich repeat protein
MHSRSFFSRSSLLLPLCALGVLALRPLVGCAGNGTETTQAAGTTSGTASTTSTTTTTATTTTTGTTGTGGATTTTTTATTGTGGAGGATTTTTGTGGAATTTTTTVSSVSSTSGGPLCGNGTLDPGEQCDDGNKFDLDGCDSNCNYEVVTRMSSIAIEGTVAPSFCVHTGNALGTKAISALALSQLNGPLQTDVTNGTVNVLTEFVGLTDDTGTNAAGFSLGVVDGALDPAKGTWPGNNPTDWWFLADPSVINMGLPTGQLHNGKIVNHVITAGPSSVSLTLNLGGTPANLQMNNAAISGTVGSATSTPAAPPTDLESGLMVLETIVANGNNQGLCGDITVSSLAQIPAPSVLTVGGSTACGGTTASCNAPQYTYCGVGMPVGPGCNSLLDVLVGGCKVVDCIVAAVNPTQPDVSATAGGTVTPLALGPGNKVKGSPTTDNDAYSAYLQFATTREHFTGESCTAATQCQTGQTCTAAVCTPQ